MKDLTPEHLRCSCGTCPAVLDLGEGEMLIIGKQLSHEQQTLVQGRVGADETGIVINRKYLANLNQK
jgi:hypothetical protein